MDFISFPTDVHFLVPKCSTDPALHLIVHFLRLSTVTDLQTLVFHDLDTSEEHWSDISWNLSELEFV